ncbi:hypothetical protein H6G65_12340 [Microcystis elabens FACHB-917]|nr:hypothetical protein [Microcystis elabens FACHB-917]
MATPHWDRRGYGLVLGCYLVLVLSALSGGLLGWDEESDYLGIRSQLAHAVLLLRGEQPDYQSIHSNLEYYGTVGLLPSWLLWFLQRGLLTGSLSFDRALFSPAVEHQLTGFFAISHAVLLAEMVLLSLVAVALARRLSVRHSWLAGALLLATPSLLGHSFVNTKDLPFAFFYSLYTLGLIDRARQPPAAAGLSWPPGRPALLALLGATLMVNQKLVALLPVLVSEAVLALLRWHRQTPRARAGADTGRPWGRPVVLLLPVLALPLAALAGALLLQPAAWGQPPLRFLGEAFATFAVHSWGGCMWFDGQCVGVRDPAWSAAGYMVRWLGAKLPLLLILLPLMQLAVWVRWAARVPAAGLPPAPGTASILLALQLLLIPTLAALRNSNLYDADRHLLFVMPPLVVLAVQGFERLLELPPGRPAWRGPRSWALALVALLAAGQLLDDLLLHPYQLAYFNEIARHRLNHTNTAVEYWSVSAKEAVQQAQLQELLPLNPTVDDSLSTLPLFIGFRQLGGRVAPGAPIRLLFQVRSPPEFLPVPPPSLACARPVEVNRRQLLAPKLVMSRLLVCKGA